MKAFKKIINHFEQIEFCGQISDPIFHPQFIEFLKLTNNKRVFIHTAASHKPIDWYIEAFDANKSAIWEFGIDGLPKDSHKYRVNQDGEFLFEMMLLAKEMGLNVSWQYIIFPYNEKTLETAKRWAKVHNIMIHILISERGQ